MFTWRQKLGRWYYRLKCPNCLGLGRTVANPYGPAGEREYEACHCRYGRKWVKKQQKD